MDTTVQVYAKSWVFEGAGEEAAHQPGDSSSSTSPTHETKSNKKNKKGHSSKLSDATSERFNAQMSSFSRCATPSPVPHSGQATPTNVIYSDYLAANNHRMHKTTRLTVDYIQSVDPAIGPDATVVIPTLALVASTSAAPKYMTKANNIQNSNGPPSVSSQQDDSQYASMLAELEQSLNDKKNHVTNTKSPDDTSPTASSAEKFGSSKSSSKDLEFSKELEAALQLIQDLETPSEGPDGTQPANSTRVTRSESEKTLSAAISLPSPEQGPYKIQTPDVQTPQNGKHDDYRRTNVIHIEPSSQSTSGYSSPNSFSSNVRLSHASSGISNSTQTHDSIYTSDKSNVVRIYIEQNSPCTTPTPGSINAVKVHGSNSTHLTRDHVLNDNLVDNNNEKNSLNKSYKKRTKLMPQTDFQNRIFKSECLAYLTDEELVARHKCNRDIIRVRHTHQFNLRFIYQFTSHFN